jgi:hypothetical protein
VEELRRCKVNADVFAALVEPEVEWVSAPVRGSQHVVASKFKAARDQLQARREAERPVERSQRSTLDDLHARCPDIWPPKRASVAPAPDYSDKPSTL